MEIDYHHLNYFVENYNVVSFVDTIKSILLIIDEKAKVICCIDKKTKENVNTCVILVCIV